MDELSAWRTQASARGCCILADHLRDVSSPTLRPALNETSSSSAILRDLGRRPVYVSRSDSPPDGTDARFNYRAPHEEEAMALVSPAGRNLLTPTRKAAARTGPAPGSRSFPPVSVIVPAYNEEMPSPFKSTRSVVRSTRAA